MIDEVTTDTLLSMCVSLGFERFNWMDWFHQKKKKPNELSLGNRRSIPN